MRGFQALKLLVLALAVSAVFWLGQVVRGGDGAQLEQEIPDCNIQKDYQNSSYELQKTCLYIDRQGIRQTNPGTFVHAIAYADFDNDGDEDVFMSSGDGSPNTTPVEMYLNDGSGNFTLGLTIFSGGVPEAVHPRKALTGDFNGDSLPDIFVIAHGYDQPPFPGEHPLLSRQQVGVFGSIASTDLEIYFVMFWPFGYDVYCPPHGARTIEKRSGALDHFYSLDVV